MNKKIFLSLSLLLLTSARLSASEAKTAEVLYAVLTQANVTKYVLRVNAQALSPLVSYLSPAQQQIFKTIQERLNRTESSSRTPVENSASNNDTCYVPERYRNYDSAGDRYTDTRAHPQPGFTTHTSDGKPWYCSDDNGQPLK